MPDQVKQVYVRPIAESEWVTVFAPLCDFRQGATASVRVDTMAAWPTQHATWMQAIKSRWRRFGAGSVSN